MLGTIYGITDQTVKKRMASRFDEDGDIPALSGRSVHQPPWIQDQLILTDPECGGGITGRV